jgi:Uma2 family endonuclease
MQTLERTEQPVFSPLLRRYTLEEFWALSEPEGRAHYDLIGGYLFMVPPPDPPHGDLDSRLNASLRDFIRLHSIHGEVYHPRESIYLDELAGTYIEPDMMFVSDELRARMGQRRTSADIVFEYLSASTATYDRTTKADTYLALGVRELWLIDPVTATIEVRYARINGNQPIWETRVYRAGEWAESRVLTGWRVSVDDLFKGLV